MDGKCHRRSSSLYKLFKGLALIVVCLFFFFRFSASSNDEEKNIVNLLGSDIVFEKNFNADAFIAFKD